MAYLCVNTPHVDVYVKKEYLYDLQIREQTAAGNLSTIKYTTWMFGKFTLNPDITTI